MYRRNSPAKCGRDARSNGVFTVARGRIIANPTSLNASATVTGVGPGCDCYRRVGFSTAGTGGGGGLRE